MGLITGSVSASRFNVTRRPDRPDFEQLRFREIAPGSEVRQSIGFCPYEPGADYQIGHERWAFRVRIDRLRPDPTRVRERLRDLIHIELEEGAEVVGPSKRRRLRKLAEEEILSTTSPTSKIIECCIDDEVVYVASTAKSQLGLVAELLRKIDVETEPKTPWIDRGETDDYESSIVKTQGPGESALGCRMMRELMGDSTLTIEPENGRVKLQTRDAKIALAGTVIHDLFYFLEHDAEILAAKMVAEDVTFDFDALAFRVSNMRLQTESYDTWQEQLNERLERISEVFEMLDVKYFELFQ